MVGDYISREAAKEALYKTAKEYDEYDKCDRIAIIALNNVDEILDDIPAVDVVAVVRCRECANWQSGWKPSAAKDGTHFCANVGLCTPSDWYCADGERKDGGQDDV